MRMSENTDTRHNSSSLSPSSLERTINKYVLTGTSSRGRSSNTIMCRSCERNISLEVVFPALAWIMQHFFCLPCFGRSFSIRNFFVRRKSRKKTLLFAPFFDLNSTFFYLQNTFSFLCPWAVNHYSVTCQKSSLTGQGRLSKAHVLSLDLQ